jgi:hypothetical protein
LALAGRELSEEARRKNSEAQKKWNEDNPGMRKGIKRSEEARANISKAKMGKKPSAQALLNMSLAQKGRRHSAETKEKIAESNRRRSYSEETLKKMKASQRVGESGCRGVQWDRQVNKWKVRLNINGKRRYFGHYASLEGAIERAQNASQENTA